MLAITSIVVLIATFFLTGFYLYKANKLGTAITLWVFVFLAI